MRYLMLMILTALLLANCKTAKQNKDNEEKIAITPDVISFLVMKIHKDASGVKNIVELVTKKETTGKFKKQYSTPIENYLTIYSYSGKQVVDSVLVEHPLYKHFEYIDEHKNFAVKDTAINSAEFFVRLQGHCSEIKILETLKNKPTIQLNSLKI